MEPRIQYAKTSDGVSIAYTVMGEGPPLVMLPPIYFQCSYISKVPGLREFLDSLGRHQQLILYDNRGAGLSQRDVPLDSLDARVRDLEAVVSAMQLTRTALFGSTLGGTAAIAYAARHPERVTHLVLEGTFSRGVDVMPWEQLSPLIELCRTNWAMAAQAIADMSVREEFAEIGVVLGREWKENADGAFVAAALTNGYADDVTDLLASITTPALILHRRNDAAIPFSCGQKLAAHLPNARLVTLEGSVHAYFVGDSSVVLEALHAFLGEGVAPQRPRAAATGVATILFTDIVDSTALTQRLGDARAQELVRAHNVIVREALAANAGAEIKHTGDGIMASFATASAGIECAIAIQRAVAERDDANLQVYIGLNAGEPVAEEQDLFGTSVQLARRLCDQAEAGQILASNVVRELAAGKGFLFADTGDVALKGFEDLVRVFEVRWRD